MTQLILNIKKRSKVPFLKELLNEMSFVEVIDPSKQKITFKEKQLLTDIEESVGFINKYKKGKVKAKSINELLDEL
ncbi:MAG: hypothetical protein IM574_01850 [Cytophagales bacterium]|jgi:hypothetical protein|nr:hypothetical protein [Cytophagales bacterium]MCA6389082.1 hypothetical protein [Cytophagales bacterium]MCA6393535.1 hypothetical protein [Cytophagales bacterium]MCA6396126.1 hypothetical protein [Cytophagales bacterium]MCA6399625.1 hypothetical protein [Cytophagales bacterium]